MDTLHVQLVRSFLFLLGCVCFFSYTHAGYFPVLENFCTYNTTTDTYEQCTQEYTHIYNKISPKMQDVVDRLRQRLSVDAERKKVINNVISSLETMKVTYQNNTKRLFMIELVQHELRKGLPTRTVTVYMTNKNQTDTVACDTMYAISKKIPHTTTLVRDTLLLLLAGPTLSDTRNGFVGISSEDVRPYLQSVVVQDGMALVNFSGMLRDYIPHGSCGDAAMMAMLEKTLLQFSTVQKVVFALDGDPLAFYEMIQIGVCPYNIADIVCKNLFLSPEQHITADDLQVKSIQLIAYDETQEIAQYAGGGTHEGDTVYHGTYYLVPNNTAFDSLLLGELEFVEGNLFAKKIHTLHIGGKEYIAIYQYATSNGNYVHLFGVDTGKVREYFFDIDSDGTAGLFVSGERGIVPTQYGFLRTTYDNATGTRIEEERIYNATKDLFVRK